METTNPFVGLMGSSPFKAIQKHMRVVAECASQLTPLMESLAKGDAAQVTSACQRIIALEQQADELESALCSRLPKSLFMPVDRRDLLEMIEDQDDVADTCQKIANILMQRQLAVPAGMAQALVATTSGCVGVVQKTLGIVEELDELVEMGFGGREAEKVLKMLADLDANKAQTDQLVAKLAVMLFDHEAGMTPLAVVNWSKLLDDVGNVANAAQKAGDRMRLLLAR